MAHWIGCFYYSAGLLQSFEHTFRRRRWTLLRLRWDSWCFSLEMTRCLRFIKWKAIRDVWNGNEDIRRYFRKRGINDLNNCFCRLCRLYLCLCFHHSLGFTNFIDSSWLALIHFFPFQTWETGNDIDERIALSLRCYVSMLVNAFWLTY